MSDLTGAEPRPRQLRHRRLSIPTLCPPLETHRPTALARNGHPAGSGTRAAAKRKHNLDAACMAEPGMSLARARALYRAHAGSAGPESLPKKPGGRRFLGCHSAKG